VGSEKEGYEFPSFKDRDYSLGNSEIGIWNYRMPFPDFQNLPGISRI